MNLLKKLFKELVGCSMYVILHSRPDISVAVDYFSCFSDLEECILDIKDTTFLLEDNQPFIKFAEEPRNNHQMKYLYDKINFIHEVISNKQV